MNNTSIYRLGKNDRLKSRKQIQQLFVEGKFVQQDELRLIFMITESEKGVRAGFSVSRRYFKRAVDRNRIKRLMREAYRLQRNEILGEMGEKGLWMFLVFQGKELPPFDRLFHLAGRVLDKMNKKIRVHD